MGDRGLRGWSKGRERGYGGRKGLGQRMGERGRVKGGKSGNG